MIVAQRLSIREKDIAALVDVFQANGYEVGNYPRDLLDHVAFDVSHEESLAFFRFECNEAGNINGLRSISLDDAGLSGVLELIYPFAEGEAFIIVTGEHQCELEGYYLRPDGVHEARNIQVVSECGQKL